MLEFVRFMMDFVPRIAQCVDKEGLEQAVMANDFKRGFLAAFCECNTLMLFINDERRIGVGKFLQHACDRSWCDIEAHGKVVRAG